ncbi:LacI family DNA-binding transcriptional regulator [Microbacterium sp. 22296]|uniref:LacI family DNA-binding transcriptional regulator n=1 Tax=Microbacterium sp. 22296 TaxID=3453903 RepID=UPI003F868ED4
MGQKRVTMADVARLAGVSTTAVSLIMNDRQGTRLSADAAARVRAAADTLGYRPNLTARALSTQKSHVIGFISDQVTTDRLASGLIRGALREAKKHGHVLFIAETDGEDGAVDGAIEALLDRQVDGIIYAATRPHALSVPELVGVTPVVMLNATAEGARGVVLADEYQGARDIVTLLLDAGHTTDVVILGRSLDQPDDEWLTVAVQRRLDGIWDALRSHDVVPMAQIPVQPWSMINGYRSVRALIDDGSVPAALICLNDRLAFGAYRALGEAGLRVGRDVAVVSFDDDDIAVYLDPMLTTAAAPFEEMGAAAVRLLLAGAQPEQEHLVPVPLRVRGSVDVPPDLARTFETSPSEPDWVR